MNTHKIAVIAGDGIGPEVIAAGFLFREVAEMEADMVAIPLDPPVYTNISLVWKKDRYLSDSARAFIEYVKSIAQ